MVVKLKVAWIAWILFGFVCLITLRDVINEFANPKPDSSIIIIFSDLVLVMLQVEFALVAALIISRQPRNLIGWLLLAPAFSLVIGSLLPDYQSWTTAPSETTWGLYVGIWYSGWSWLLLIFPVFLITLLFPTGRPPSRRWNWVAYLALFMPAFLILVGTFSKSFTVEQATWVLDNPIGFIPVEFGSGTLFMMTWGAGLVILAVSSVASLFVRYRQSRAVEREQIKWLLYACGLFGATYALTVLIVFLGDFLATSSFFTLVFFLPMATIPVAIAIAILRYRLWDIDVIIRKTLVYGILTAAMGLVFFGGVTLMQQVFGAVTGTDNSPVAIVLSTLAIAALFNPLRWRVQDFIDRRFFRKKYNAEQALVQFAVAARSETDIEQLSAELVTVVGETMQPESISLWMTPSGSRNRPGYE